MAVGVILAVASMGLEPGVAKVLEIRRVGTRFAAVGSCMDG